MPAPSKNEFWKQRKSNGRKPIFDSPEQLWEACCEYFQWVEDNPHIATQTQYCWGRPIVFRVPKMRAMTISGLCLSLGITRETWRRYGKKKRFSDITMHVENIIYEQKFTGAAAGLLNPCIIARDLSLRGHKVRTTRTALDDLHATAEKKEKPKGPT